jgi:hypothetical protein
VITEINGRAIYWNGHLCEGDRMIPHYPSTFRLWTRCKQYEVPLSAARTLEPKDEITCEICRQFLHPA